MTANGVAKEKHVAVLLNIIGAKMYSLLCNLLSPPNPKEKMLAQTGVHLQYIFIYCK